MQAHEHQAEPERHSPVDDAMPASRIAAKFGGCTGFATALGKAPSTVHRWLVSGFIPGKYQNDVLAAAKEKRISIKPADFIAAA